MDTNSIVVKGRMVRDGELTYFGQKNTAKLKFSIANNTGYGDFKHTNFFTCELYGKGAEGLAPYMTQGKAVILTGELKQERWETQDGEKKSMMKIIARSVDFAGDSKKQEQDGVYAPHTTAATIQQPQQQAPNPFANALNQDPMPQMQQTQFKAPDSSGYKESLDDVPFGTF